MKQLDAIESPAAFVWNHYLTLTHVTPDLELCDLWRLHYIRKVLENEFILVTFGPVTGTWTNRSDALCSSKGGFKHCHPVPRLYSNHIFG